MARNAFSPTTGSGAGSKLLGLLILLAVLTIVVKDPVGAAQMARGLARLAGGAIDGISIFLRAVVTR